MPLLKVKTTGYHSANARDSKNGGATMYCPQCGTESSSGQQYCRSCGANLKVIGKAVSLSEAIARSDRGPLPKIKEMMKNLKIEHVTEEVSSALDKMNKEIVRTAHGPRPPRPWWLDMTKEKTPEQRRERHLVKGTISLFWGTGLTVFLYYLSAALVLKLPPDVIARIPFEIDPVVRILWLLGVIPILSGLGHIVAGLSIRPRPASATELSGTPQPTLPDEQSRPAIDRESQPAVPRGATPREAPASVTERTTNILERDKDRWNEASGS